jgi:hypothetical protein
MSFSSTPFLDASPRLTRTRAPFALPYFLEDPSHRCAAEVKLRETCAPHPSENTQSDIDNQAKSIKQRFRFFVISSEKMSNPDNWENIFLTMENFRLPPANVRPTAHRLFTQVLSSVFLLSAEWLLRNLALSYRPQ